MLRVVFHVNETEKWQAVLGNIRNLLEETTVVEVIVVVNGQGITGYLDELLCKQMEQLQVRNVRFEACQNALNGHNITRKQLPKWVFIVPAGIVRLIELQPKYAYIKP